MSMANWRIVFISLFMVTLVIIKGCSSYSIDNCFKHTSCITDLGLIAGHLRVGEELLNQGTPIQAEPHFSHPVRELYSKVENYIKSKNIELSRETLNNLDKLVQQKPSDPQIKQKLSNIYSNILELMKLEEQSPKNALEVIVEILRQAEGHYRASVEENQDSGIRTVTNFTEYEDVRGFVFCAEEIYQKISSKVSQESLDAHQRINASLATLKSISPLNPPKPKSSAQCSAKSSNHTLQCLKSLDEVIDLINNIENASQTINS
jgi:hypothetical protein